MQLVHFNLKPYRAVRDQRLRRWFFAKQALIGLALLSVLWSVDSELNNRLVRKAAQAERIRAMEADLGQRVSQAEKLKAELDALQIKIRALESVDAQTQWSARVMALLDKGRPGLVELHQLSLKGEWVVMRGQTPALAELTRWMRQLESSSDLIERTELKSVRAAKPEGSLGASDRLHDFELHIALKRWNVNSPPQSGVVAHAGA